MRDKHFNFSDRILHILLLNSNFLSDFGLFTGKTGLAITFAHLHRQTLNSAYDDCLGELLDDIMRKTYKGLNIDFASGFTGIGWGLEYLLQNGFVEGNGIDTCKELDLKIMERDPRRITDLSLDTGLEGLLHYVLAHLHGAASKRDILPFDEIYLNDLYYSVLSIEQCDLSVPLKILIDKYINWYTDRHTLDYQMDVTLFIKDIEVNEKRFSEYPLGIRDGLAGILLKQYLQ